MAVLRPYRRTCRQFIEGSYGGSGNWAYILHKKYAKSPEQYIRAFLLLQKDLHNLFDYIEPSDQNLAWDSGGALPWYKAYNETKHNRHDSFKMATFEHMLDAVCGLLVLLSAQFYTYSFSSSDWFLSVGDVDDEMESAIGGYFRINFPSNWNEEERYDFNWNDLLQKEEDPFQSINFSILA